MEPLLVYPAPPDKWVSDALERLCYPWTAVPGPALADRDEPENGFAGAVISGLGDPAAGLRACRILREGENPVRPVLFVVDRGCIAKLELEEDLFDDFVVVGATAEEFGARLDHLFWRTGRGKTQDLIVYGPLALNLETYQAAIDARPLDLTFMEYELLRFLAAHPGKVFTREALLSRVWGYEYFGGARTVDVHVRRLRAKLGEEHAHLIETVRSVGYRFGAVHWPVPDRSSARSQ
ncbi:MAG: response regulator transcription factor [Acidimicrobiales bacterium]|jgi:DNA-binding response OmpR family regulator